MATSDDDCTCCHPDPPRRGGVGVDADASGDAPEWTITSRALLAVPVTPSMAPASARGHLGQLGPLIGGEDRRDGLKRLHVQRHRLAHELRYLALLGLDGRGVGAVEGELTQLRPAGA